MTQGILAIDIGLTFGWALISPEGRVTFGEEKLGDFSGLQSGARFPAFRGALVPVFTAWEGRGILAYEKVRGAMWRDEIALSLYGMRAGLMELVARHGWPTVMDINPSTLKKWATGMGKASKGTMIQEAKTRWGLVEKVGNNEADALLILSWAMKLTKRTEAGPARRCGGGPAIAPIKLAGHDRTGEWGYEPC